MIGLLLWKSPEAGKRQKSVVLSECSVLQMRFVCVEILRGAKTPEAILRRRVLVAAKKFRRAGVTEIVPPARFAYLPQLEKCGVRPVSTLALRRALAGAVVRSEVSRLGLSPTGARVAVAGENLTGELVKTVRELALMHRYVLLDVPRGGAELCRQLRREYGVSLLLNPSKEQLDEAEVLVLFSPREDLAGKNSVLLPLYEGAEACLPPMRLPQALEGQLPEGADRTALLAALQRAGAIRAEQVLLGT